MANNTHTLTYPLQRRDLADYFPTTAKFYPGYVKMAVFREKLKLLITAVSVGGNIRDLLLNGVDSTDWRPEDLTAKLQAELRKKALEHAEAAALDPATRFVGGKAVKKVSGYAKSGLTKVSANPKVNAKFGKTINAITKDYQYGDIKLGKIQVKSKTFEPSIKVVDGNIIETGTGYVMGKATDGTKKWVSDKTGWALPNGVDMSLNNENTRSWMTRFGVPEGVAFWTMEVIDILSDFFPPASLTKSVESFFANSYMAFRYWNDARALEETKKFFDEKWNKITSELKKHIKTDLKALNDTEFRNLCNLLFDYQ